MRKGKTKGKPQGRKNKLPKAREINKQKNINISGTLGNQAPQQQLVSTQQNKVYKEISDVYGRSSWLTLLLILICGIVTAVTYLTTPPITIITIMVSLTFAGFLTIISTFFNQHRFHYRYLLMNESVSRFISVLGSALLAKIIKFGEKSLVQTRLIIPAAFFFFLAIIFYALSVIFTNQLKEYLNDGKRHECEPKTKEYNGNPVLQTEGINQKLCGKTEGKDWVDFRSDLDSITNRNIQFFLGFYFLMTMLLIYLQMFSTPASAFNIVLSQ